MPRKQTTQQERETRRSTVLKAAKPVFAAHGYRSTTMDAIAKAAGISVGAVYLAFPHGKREIYKILYEESLDSLADSFEEALNMPATDIRGRICILLYSYINFYRHQHQSYLILSGGLMGDNTIITGDRRLRDKGIDILRQIEQPIIEGVKQGTIKSRDTFKMVVSLWGMFDGIIMLAEKARVSGLGLEFRDCYVQAINIILDGLLADHSSGIAIRLNR